MNTTARAAPPVAIRAVLVRQPVIVSTVRASTPIVLNATLGRAGLWTGAGPPATIVGAVIGDEYLDTTTGTIYRLDPGA